MADMVLHALDPAAVLADLVEPMCDLVVVPLIVPAPPLMVLPRRADLAAVIQTAPVVPHGVPEQELLVRIAAGS
jgi:hypothetical protein